MKKNSFLDRMEREKQAAMLHTHRFTRQLMVDLSFIALNKRFGLGAKRLTEFANDLRDLYAEYADLWNGDTADTSIPVRRWTPSCAKSLATISTRGT